MLPASYASDPTEQLPWPRVRWPWRGAPGEGRTSFRPGRVATDVIGPTSTVPHLQLVADATVPGGCGWCSAFVLTASNDHLAIDAGKKNTLASYSRATVVSAINNFGNVAGDSVPTGGSGATDGHAVIWQVLTGTVSTDLSRSNRGATGPSAINHTGWVAGYACSTAGVSSW